MNRYTLEDKPEYKYGDMVVVDVEAMGVEMKPFGLQPFPTGKIVGISVRGIIDQWMVEFDFEWPSYPYKVVSIPHIFIIKPMIIKK